MKKFSLSLLALAAAGLAALALALYFSPRPPLLEGSSFGRIVLNDRGGILRISLSADEKYRLYAPLDQIAPEAERALLAYEDKYYYLHPGVNPFALARAALSAIPGMGRRLGASTISMQTARLRFNLGTSSVVGKITQIWKALLLERHYSKQEILEAYFNLAPYGGNIEGIEAAARIYFNKSASQLTDLETHALAVIPQNPAGRNPLSGKDFNAARHRLEKILADNENVETPPALFARNPAGLPFVAPHLAMELLEKEKESIIRSCVQNDLQTRIEKILKSYAQRGRRFGVNNASALLVNAQSMEAVAIAGSADFFNSGIFGQVDGTRARRSPGSTLKPFIYAMALDQGLIQPMTILPDSPRSFGGYDPENFDKDFRGPLPALDALKTSRNLPAIILAEQLRHPGLYGFLRAAGIDFPREADYYGLALALGGAEVNMRELASLYAMLANGGVWRPLRLLKNEACGQPRRLLSPEAAWLTLWMLERPEARIFGKNGQIPLRYKTGTSNGMRDAWTAGVFGDYVLVVWVGNFDNSANPYFVGAISALPLFTEIAQAVASLRTLADAHPERERELNLERAPVCQSTGDFNIAHCQATAETVYIPGVSPVRDSGILRPILIDKATGLRACAEAPGQTEEVWWEFWPTDMQNIFARAGINKPAPPDWLPQCREKQELPKKRVAGKGPRIVLPKKNLSYQRKIGDKSFRIPLLAAADQDVDKVHWFSGKEYIGSARPGETIFWKPQAAEKLDLLVVDEFGASARRQCRIGVLP